MSQPVLLLIDVQQGLDDPDLGQRCNPDAEINIALLLAHWRSHMLPLIHIQHNSIEASSKLRPELPGNAFKHEAQPLPGETIFSKTGNSAFVGTGLKDHLHQNHWTTLVIVGLTTDHCVSASTRSASDLGFDVKLIADATATFERIGFDGRHFDAQTMHEVNLASLNGEFCRVLSTQECLQQMSLEKN